MATKQNISKTNFILYAIGLLLITASFLVMIGWVFRLKILVQIFPGLVPMQFNTAICFFLSGIIIALSTNKNNRLILTFSGLVFIIGLVSLIQYIAKINTGLDTLFIKPFITTKTSHPGRMAPNTALSFTIFSIYFFLAKLKLKKIYPYLILLPFTFGGFGLISLLGYIFSIEQGYAWGSLTHMALHTSIGFLILAIGLIVIFIKKHRLSGKEIFYIRQYSIIATILIFSFFIWLILKSENIKNINIKTHAQLNSLSDKLETRIHSESQAILRIFARFDTNSYKTVNALDSDASYYFKHMPFLLGLNFSSPERKFHRVLISHANNNAFSLAALQSCIKANTKNSTKSLNMLLINQSILCIFKNDSSAAINIKMMIDSFLSSQSKNYITKVSNKNQLNSNTSTNENLSEFHKFWLQSKSIKIYDNEFRLIIYPKNKYIKELTNLNFVQLFVFAIVIGIFILYLSSAKYKLAVKERKIKGLEATNYAILHSLSDGVVSLNKNLNIKYMNPSAEKILDLSFQHLKNNKLSFMININDKKNGFINTAKDSIRHKKAIRKDKVMITTKQGKSIPVSFQASPIMINNSIQGVVIIFSDITERVNYEKDILYHANYDALTGLPNRRQLLKSLQSAIERYKRSAIGFSLFFIDMNKFKQINDNYGHHVGDKVLKYIANKISSVTRKNDVLARLSGDEFCLILEGITTDDDLIVIKSNIKKLFSDEVRIDNITITVSLAMGGVIYDGKMSVDELMIKSDKKMYLDKINSA